MLSLHLLRLDLMHRNDKTKQLCSVYILYPNNLCGNCQLFRVRPISYRNASIFCVFVSFFDREKKFTKSNGPNGCQFFVLLAKATIARSGTNLTIVYIFLFFCCVFPLYIIFAYDVNVETIEIQRRSCRSTHFHAQSNDCVSDCRASCRLQFQWRSIQYIMQEFVREQPTYFLTTVY